MRSLKSRGGITRGRDITVSVRNLWIGSMHRCTGIHDGMGNLTGQLHCTSEQHTELGKSRIRRDNSDLDRIIAWFDMHDPFNPAEQSLKCISSGLTAQTNDEINCDDAENIGYVIQQNLDNVRFDDASIKRNSKVKSLDKLCPGTLIDKKLVHIDPMILLTRLITLVQREESMTDAFM